MTNNFIKIKQSKKSINLRTKVYELGINDADYIILYKEEGVRKYCPYYSMWVNMLKRCYSQSYQRNKPTYIGCSVCSEWLIFSNFKTWVEQQDWKGKHLDKDLLVRGNTEYSPNKCVFVSSQVNTLLNNSKASRGEYAIGVAWSKHHKKFQAKCTVLSKPQHLGFYDTEAEAHEVYLAFKKNLIITTATQQTDLKLKEALLKIAQEEY